MDIDGNEYENYVLNTIKKDYEHVWHRENIPKNILEANKILMNPNLYTKYENNDIGFDLLAYKNGEYYFIQCKDFPNSTVNIKTLGGFYFIIYEYNLNGIVYYNGNLSQRIIDLQNNRVKYIYLPTIKKKNKIITVTDEEIYKYMVEHAKNNYIVVKHNKNSKLYEYNNYWTFVRNMDKFIELTLCENMKNKIINNWSIYQPSQLKYIEKLKKNNNAKMKLYEKYINDNTNVQYEIEFDNKWWLFGFTNTLYDLELEKFRDYNYDDYVSIITGYEWREPSLEELETVNKLINLIMPIEEERKLYLQLLCTALEGRCLEKCIIWNGCGSNGKGVMNDLLLLALGNYGLIGNNAILFECSKTGSNPEKANLHKKRYIVFREPPEKRKFENSVIKELTGGGGFSARTLHEKETEKELHSTIIVECNKRPLFSEEPTNAEVRRIIDIYFRSTFTTEESLLNSEKYIYMADCRYKTKEFQHQHKYALLKILMEEHKKYKKNNYIFNIPKSIEDRTKNYLELSCNIVQWFKDNYEYTDNKQDICKIKDIFDKFVRGEYYQNLTKMEKRKYNKTFFIDYIETNIFFKKYYFARVGNSTNVIKYWKESQPNRDD